MKTKRQNLLVLYLHNSSLSSPVKAWTQYNGADGKDFPAGETDEPPYKTGLDALRDGWRVLQFPQLIPPYPGVENTTSYMKHEFVFEKLIETDV